MKLTIRTKLITGFLLLLALLIVIGLVMISELSRSNERLNDILDRSGKKVTLSHEILISVLEAARHEKNLILEKEAVKKDLYKDQVYEALQTIDKKSAELSELVDEKGKVFYDAFNLAWTNYKSDLDSIIFLCLNNKTEAAFIISIDRGAKVRDDAVDQLGKLILKNEKQMEEARKENDAAYDSAQALTLALLALGIFVAFAVSYWIITSITKRISVIAMEAKRIASRELSGQKLQDNTSDELSPVFASLSSVADSFQEVTDNANTVAAGNYGQDFVPRSEKDMLGNALRQMTIALRETTEENIRHNWLATGQNLLNEKLIGDQEIEQVAGNAIEFLCDYTLSGIGAVYLLTEDEKAFELTGRYSFSSASDQGDKFSFSEGIIGQAASSGKQLTLSGIEDHHLRVTSTLVGIPPNHILVTPFRFEGKVLGVVEMGKQTEFNDVERTFINDAMESIAITINSAIARKQIRALLEETQVQSEELQSQQEELKQMNEELEEQAQNLKQQQEELQMTNEELEEQTQSLEMKNREVEAARSDIEQKTRQLEVSSRYKSEFLANMSHELRTPLNSLLILSRDLADNKRKNLDDDQVESAEIINKSGHDLLTLINEVLDLSKIEAGKMDINLEDVELSKLCSDLLRDFRHHADQKKLKLEVNLKPGLPQLIRTDLQRLNQVLRNLLSNAIKFTEQGGVTVTIEPFDTGRLRIVVADTGIGIPEDQQMAVFEAFRQAEGGTSRKYGGTGLGLSISRELAKLLKGEINLTSTPGKGSVFTLIIPLRLDQPDSPQDARAFVSTPAQPKIEHKSFLDYPGIKDDRELIEAGDKIVLVIEDDLQFAAILAQQAREKGFRCLAAATGEDGLVLADQFKPQAIILDVDLPGMNGDHVLAELKSNAALRHIPVHIISVNERSMNFIRSGAIEYLVKPVDKKSLDDAFTRIGNFVNRQMKNLLIVEDDANARKAMKKLIGNGDVKCLEAGSGKEALDAYTNNHIDCIVLDIGLPDMSGFDLVKKFAEAKDLPVPPIVVYTGRELTREENSQLEKYAESVIIKGVKSEERLLDETALFLHRTIGNLPEGKQEIINNLYNPEAIFTGRKVLLVDDDMRNVFALSKILKERGMEVIKAENGKTALAMLEQHPAIDIVLMDIMMPEMDGYEAMKRIRGDLKKQKLPIIALTAKAMKDDKQKCIDAGANDYITKPVDVDRLLTLMRVWLSK